MQGGGRHRCRVMRRLEKDLGATVPVADGDEVASPDRSQPDGICDMPAVYPENVTGGIIGGSGAGMKLQPGEVENIVPGEMVDGGLEDVVRECRVLDLEPGGAGKGD